MFSTTLRHKFTVFKTIDDSTWWNRIYNSTLNEAIEEIKKLDVDLNNIDIEWEALLSKQIHNYQNMWVPYKIDPLSTTIHLFKATNVLEDIPENCMNNYEKLFNQPKLGWENNNLSINFNVIPICGDHFTMMPDPKNRSSLGKKLTELIESSLNLPFQNKS